MELLNTSARRVVLCTLVAVAAASPAFAQDLSPLTNFLVNIGDWVTGEGGAAAALIALVAVGFMCWSGRAPIMYFFLTCVGIVIVFAAGTILAGFETA